MACETRKGAHSCPTVVSCGAHVGPIGRRSDGQTKKSKSLVNLNVLIMTTPEAFSGPQTAKRQTFSFFGPNFHWLFHLDEPYPYLVLWPIKRPVGTPGAPKRSTVLGSKAHLGAHGVLQRSQTTKNQNQVCFTAQALRVLARAEPRCASLYKHCDALLCVLSRAKPGVLQHCLVLLVLSCSVVMILPPSLCAIQKML